MKFLVAFLVVAALAAPKSAEAITYTYTGSNYDSTSYSDTSTDVAPIGTEPISYTRRGPYTESMNLSFSFTVDTYLAPDTTYERNSGGWLEPQGVIGSNAPIELLGFQVFDGINGPILNTLDITTDSSGKIVEWWVQGDNGGSVDFDFFKSELSAGVFSESAFYTYEYAFFDADRCGEGVGCIGTETSQAFASEMGYWSVPIPASLPLLMAGVGGLGFMARRKRASGRSKAAY